MKKTITILALIVFSMPAMAEEKECETEIQKSPNPIVGVISFPFKIVAALAWGPVCLAKKVVPNIDE